MYKHLDEFAYSICHNPELHVGASRFVEIIERRTPTDPFVTRQVAAIRGEVDKLEDSLKNTNRSPLTAELAQKDLRRDKAFRSFLGFLDGMSMLSVEPDKQKAAQALLAIISRHGRNLDRKAYARETSGLQIVLEELSTGTARQQLELLGATHLAAELQEANADFERCYQEKVVADAQQSFPAATPTRGDLGYRLNALLAYLDVNQTDGLGSDEAMIKELNEAIGEIMAKARARRSRRQNGLSHDNQAAADDS